MAAEQMPISPRGLRRKVTSSGVVWVQGRSYYVSRQLAGRTISIDIIDDQLIIDVTIRLHKEYRLPRSMSPVRALRAQRDDP